MTPQKRKKTATKRNKIVKVSFFSKFLCFFVAVFVTRRYFSTRAFDLQLALNVALDRADRDNIVVFSSDFPLASRGMASIGTSPDLPRCRTASSEKSWHVFERF